MNNLKDNEVFDLRVNKGILPKLDIEGHAFYVDIQMNKLRPKDDFLSRGISFADIDHYYDDIKEMYIIPYDHKKREFREIDYEKITEIPKDLVVIQFPHESILDPVGWSRKGGYDIMDGLNIGDIKIHFRAKQGKWDSFALSEIIKENLRSKDKDVDLKDEIRNNKGRKM